MPAGGHPPGEAGLTPASADASATVIHGREIVVRYQRGGEAAVDGVDIDLAPGQGLVVTGGRGSGKSSLLRAVMGLAGPGGDTTVFGARPGSPDALRRIGWAPQSWPFTYGVRTGEAIRMVAALKGYGPEEAARAMDEAGFTAPAKFAPLLEIEEARQASLACALIGTPDLLVLDDPWEFTQTDTAIHRALDRGAAVLVASSEPDGLLGILGVSITLKDGRRA